MFYYEIWVGSTKFHANKPLTYSCDDKLQLGEVVDVPLRNKKSLGFVHKEVNVDKALSSKIKSVLSHSKLILPLQSRKLHDWMQQYYPSPSGTITNLFLPPLLITKESSFDPKPEVPAHLPPLTSDQIQAIKTLEKTDATSLLFGETGTGKTRVYLELAQKSIKSNQSVVILTPEIGLTPQLARDFSEMFPNKTIVLHSNLTPAKRRDSWHRIATSAEPLIIIGPRSALFAPLKSIGLIVLDEAHEHTYKQEQAPYYHASRVAAQLAKLHKARCVIASATPLVNDYFLFEQKKMPIIRMTELARGKVTPPKVKIIDLKNPDEIRRSTSLSKSLVEGVEETLAKKQQVLLFLNRRGSARMILCQNCGWQATCPHCDIALTYHADRHQLRCHTCGYNQPIVTSCPVCKSNEIVYQTPGTKSLEDEARQIFTGATIKRFDSDNLAEEKLERHFIDLVEAHVDIIIGTQLITKGLDLPQLGLVGIINADASLNFPDYTAEEKTYQLLRQVIGRVGRHQQSSNVIVQTFNPDNPLLQLAITSNWADFYAKQLDERQQFGFPPFYHLLQLRVARATRASAQTASNELAKELRSGYARIKLRGPSPQLHEKVRGKYHWQIIVSSKERSHLLEIIKNLPSGWQHNIDPFDLM
jgi:primosomal protein N' (replication factor Y)